MPGELCYLQRLSAVMITAAATALALSGQRAFELVEGAYAMSLVGMFVPFVVGIYVERLPKQSAIASMLVGTASWFVHVLFGWEHFAQSIFCVSHPARVSRHGPISASILRRQLSSPSRRALAPV